MFFELFQLALGNLTRARMRLIMTASGVLVGTTAVILLIALTIGLQRSAEMGIGSDASLTEIRVSAAFSADENIPQLDDNAVTAFQALSGVAAVIPLAGYRGNGELLAGELRSFAPIYGIDPELLPFLGAEVEEGELTLAPGQALFGNSVGDFFTDPEAEDFEPVVIDVLNEPPQLSVTSFITFDTRLVDLSVSGVLEAGNYGNAILMPIQDVIALNEWVSGEDYDPETFRYEQIVIRASSRETTSAVTAAVRDLGYQTDGVGDFLDELNRFFGTMRLMLGGIGGIAMIVAAFGVANTMTMAVLERTKEIGLMKAIGARDRDVLTVFLLEAGMVGLCGGAAGVGLSLLLQSLINQMLQSLSPDSLSSVLLPFNPAQMSDTLIVIPPELVAGAVVLAGLVGLLAGFIPALRASQMSPLMALRQE
jgi:putative ABC transport system permease protein